MRRVPPRIRAKFPDLTDEMVDYWYSLPEKEQDRRYYNAVADIRTAVYWETHFMKAGQRGFYGRGASLATAVFEAFESSPQVREREKTWREAQRTRPVVCCRTGRTVPANEAVTIGKSHYAMDALNEQERKWLDL